jgi:hypothetical protein
LQALQEKSNAAFQPPRSIDLHPRFIALNSTLKLARELDASQSYRGALYQYLEAVRHYGMLDMPAVDEPGHAQLTDAVAAWRKKLDASARDESIAQLFLERAEAHVAQAAGSENAAEEWRSAKVIAEQVFPAYFSIQEHAASAPQRSAARTADLTLVRWPYT